MRRLRQIHCGAAWPPPVLVAIFVFVYVVFNAGIWLLGRTSTNLHEAISEMSEFPQFFAVMIGAAAALHVLCRLVRFHPALNLRYASWLALSPWTAARPLPIGPIHPVWQDAAVLAILAALARWQAHIDPALPLEAAGLAYMIGLTLLLAVTSTWFSFFAMGFLWPSVLLTQGKWQPVAGIFAAMALVLWHGTWKSLQVFPWRQVDRTHPGLAKPASPNSIGQVEIRIELGSATGTSTDVGWPFAQLSPKARFNSISTATSFWVSLLIGWWAYCLMVGSGMESSPVGILGFGIIASMMRVSLYWSGLAPSFSFRSRLFFGPLIVPKFDQVFVAPITAILTAFVGAGVAAASGSCYPAAHAIFVGLILFILLAGGPTMRNWVLTGEHRFRPRITSGSSRQTFRPV